MHKHWTACNGSASGLIPNSLSLSESATSWISEWHIMAAAAKLVTPRPVDSTCTTSCAPKHAGVHSHDRLGYAEAAAILCHQRAIGQAPNSCNCGSCRTAELIAMMRCVTSFIAHVEIVASLTLQTRKQVTHESGDARACQFLERRMPRL
jgi:hypothetical protein